MTVVNHLAVFPLGWSFSSEGEVIFLVHSQRAPRFISGYKTPMQHVCMQIWVWGLGVKFFMFSNETKMQFTIILDHYYYHICVQKVEKARAGFKKKPIPQKLNLLKKTTGKEL